MNQTERRRERGLQDHERTGIRRTDRTGKTDEIGLCLISELLSILSGTGGRKLPGKCDKYKEGDIQCFSGGRSGNIQQNP